jgi:hypothetical protein
MLKSPYKSVRLSNTYVKAKTTILLDFNTEIVRENKIYFEIANRNQRFIPSLLYYFSG